MVFYRFNSLNQTLKATSAGIFSVSVAKTASGAPKYVYKPILSSTAPAVTAVASSSSHSHDHGPERVYGFHLTPEQWKGWENWNTYKDVPDHLVRTSSQRDPNNPVYSNPTYIRLRKKQIFYSRPSDLPVYLLGGQRDKINHALIWFCVMFFAGCGLKLQYENIYKKYYPDSNLFILF